MRICSRVVGHGEPVVRDGCPVKQSERAIADRVVSVFLPDRPTRVRRGDDRLDFGDVLPGLTLTVAELFVQLRLPR